MNAFQYANDELRQMHSAESVQLLTEPQSLFQRLLSNAENNALKVPQARTHSTVIKKFSTSLYLYGGPMAYNLIHQNMPTALPSLRTIQR